MPTEIMFASCFQAYDEYCQFADYPEVKSNALNVWHSVMTNENLSG